jgi:hypothetical protein
MKLRSGNFFEQFFILCVNEIRVNICEVIL